MGGLIVISKLKVFEAFAGIGACSKALSRIGLPFEIVAYSEIDKHASSAFSAIHNVDESKNLGDIRNVSASSLPDFDLMTWGFPCTDISAAGKQKGFVDDAGNITRSGLYYYGIEILRAKQPKYTLIENVKALTQKKFQREFKQILCDLDEAGYNIVYKVLNAKDYGIPQNRERVFIVGIRKDLSHNDFSFPAKIELKYALKAFLESGVDDKYFLSEETIQSFVRHAKRHKGKGTGFSWKPKQITDIASTLRDNARLCPTDNTIILNTRSINAYGCAVRTRDKTANLEVLKTPMSNAITTVQKDSLVFLMDTSNYYGIRRLTPLESFRLMGFDDEDYLRAKERLIQVYYNGRDRTSSQMYKMAGNSIVVDVLENIFVNLFENVGLDSRAKETGNKVS